MIRPLPLFALREWGTRYQPNQVCPTCRQDRLVIAPICPHCYGTRAEETDSRSDEDGQIVHTFACSACSTGFETRGRLRLECRGCSLVVGDGWHRHHFSEERPEVIRGRTEVLGELYATVQHYVSKPDGSDPYHLADFVIDIDRDGDMEAAVEATLAYARFLDEHDAYYHLFFSGGKGFHLQVPFQALGAMPSEDLNPHRYKKLARELQVRVGYELDFAIYSRRRMLRVDGSFHAKTGLYKFGLSRNDLEARGVAVLDDAKTPPSAPWISGSGTVQDVKRAPPLQGVYREALGRIERAPAAPSKSVAPNIGMFNSGMHPPCIERALEEGPPDQGTRHKLSLNVAAYWVANGLDPRTFITWAAEVPGASDTPKSQRTHEAAGAIRWAQQNRPPFRCQTMQELGFCDPACPFYTKRL